MTTGFSVYVSIGGRLNPSLAGAVSGAKTQLRGLEAITTGLAARINAPFIVAQRHINAVSKSFEKMQNKGRNLAMTVTAPVGFGAVSMVRSALERDKAGNTLEAIGGASHAERLDIEKYADKIAAKYGSATDSIKTFNELLRAGFTTPAAKGSLAAILEGSIIGETPAANAAAAVAKIATQYGLGMKTVEEASTNSRRIVDNLAFGANASPLSFDDMIQGYKFVGSAASAAGESIESTNALIVAMGKSGQTGSESGVALRSAYVRLLKPTREGRATMARLGLDYGNYVAGGKRTGAGVASGLGAFGYDVPAKDIDRALNANKGSNERQRRAIYDTVVSRLGADQAVDRDKIMEAVDGALTLSGSKVDLTKLMVDLKKKGGSQGDLARIFEGRQSVRMLSLLKSDLEGLLKEVNEGVPGYGKKTFDIKNQGLEKAVREIDASWQTLSNTLVKTVLPEITTVFSSISEWLKSLAASSPATLKLGVGLTAAAVAAGPLLFALGAIGRIALLPFRLLAGAVRLLLWPLRAVASAAVLMRGALMFTLPGAILTGLAVAGAFIYNNWKNLPVFFDSFKKSLMKNLGPGGAATGQWLIDKARDAYTWFSDLTKALSPETWRGWGTAAGEAVAGIVTYLSDLVTQATPIANEIIAKWKAADWAGLGAMIGSAIWQGIKSNIGSIASFLWNGPAGGNPMGNAITGMMNGPGGAKPAAAPMPSVPISGARALGGPVMRAKPYLVGERGPELFVPGMSGRIETNDTLRRLTADGAAAVAGSTNNTSNRSYSLNPTINIMGSDDPRAIAGQVRTEMERYLRDLEAEQRGLLSD